MYWPVGLSPKLLKLGAALFIVALLVVGGFFMYKSIYQDGYDAAEAVWMAKVEKNRADSFAALQAKENENRQRELALSEELLRVYTEKDNAIRDINADHQRLVDSLRNRATRAAASGQPQACGNPEAPATICSREGSTGAQLSREDAEFLAGEAARAETLRKSLAFCRRAYENVSGP